MNYEIYVGSNNETGELEILKIRQITARFYDGATFSPVSGLRKGKLEKTVKIEVVSNKSVLKEFVSTLKTELEQEEIGIREISPLKFY